VLGVTPFLGRPFLNADAVPGGNTHVVLLSYDYWQREMGGDRGVIGRQIRLRDLNSDWAAYGIIGVMPRGFTFPYPLYGTVPEIWAPAVVRETASSRRIPELTVIARLKPGVSLAQARSEMDVISKRLQGQYPDANRGWEASIVSFSDELGGDARAPLKLLLGATFLVLLIGCVNISAVLLARSTARDQETAMRLGLGATRWRVIRQLLAEYSMLGIFGALLGLFVCYFSVHLLRSLAPPGIPRLESVGINMPVLAFTIGTMALAVLAFGLGPALHATRLNLNETLRKGSTYAGRAKGVRRLHQLLAVFQVGFSFTLIAGAALLLDSLYQIQKADLGFNATQVVTERLLLPGFKYEDESRRSAVVRQLLERFQSFPGVVSVSAASNVPGATGWRVTVAPVNGELSDLQEQRQAELRIVTPAYFSTLDIPLLAGRVFSEADSESSPRVAVINHLMAQRYWPGENPMGKQVNFEHEHGPFTIVGIVGDTKHFGFQNQPQSEGYIAFYQAPVGGVNLMVRFRGSAGNVASLIAQEVRATDSDILADAPTTLEDLASRTMSEPSFQAILLAGFAGLAIVLVLVGVYGIVSFSTAQRSREIAVRIALGALPRNVLIQIVGENALIAFLGELGGVALSIALARLIANYLYGSSSAGLATLVGVAILLFVAVLIASLIPAQRAARTDPLIILRSE
jgi:putative ABC transport system permease protein